MGLDGLQRHPSLPQPGQAGVAQLVTGSVRQPGPSAGAVEDLVEPVGAQRPAAPGTFEHQKHRVGVGVRGPFLLEVGAQVLEEPPRDRHEPLVPTFAVSDEQPPLRGPHVLQAQPEDLAAPQPAEQHRGDHGRSRCVRNALVRASTSPRFRIGGSVRRGARTNGTPWVGR